MPEIAHTAWPPHTQINESDLSSDYEFVTDDTGAVIKVAPQSGAATARIPAPQPPRVSVQWPQQRRCDGCDADHRRHQQALGKLT